MKNSKLVKIVLIIMISLAIIVAAKGSFAVTSLDPNSLTGLTTNNTTNNTVENSSNTTLNNTTTNLVLTTNNTTTTNVSNNASNTSLPKTGVADSMPIVVIAVVLGISAVYAYKKMEDYKNI